MGLLKGDIQEETKILINELVKLAINYNGNLNYVNSKIKELKDKNKNLLLDNYFIKSKIKYFISREIDYSLLPTDCRTNNILENYHKLMKESLGKNK